MTYRIGIDHGILGDQAGLDAMRTIRNAIDPYCTANYSTIEITTYCIADGGLKPTLSAIARNRRKSWSVLVNYQEDQ